MQGLYEPYFSGTQPRQNRSAGKGIIFFLVVTVHAAVGLLPLLFQLYTRWANPPDKVFVDKVVLVDSAPNDNTIPSLHPGKAAEPSDDTPAPPKPLEPLPELPDPQPEPVTQPKPVQTPQPKPVEIPKTPDPKAPALPKPAVKPKLTPKKVQQKPTVEDIRREIQQRRAARPAKQKTRNRDPQTVQHGQGQNQALQALAKELKGMAGGVQGGTGTGTAGGAGGPKGEYDPTMDNYYARVSACIRARWVNRPSINALGASRPVVRVDFVVDARGRILSKEMRPSGNQVMDSSVERFLQNLRELPVPPGNRTLRFWVDMRVED